VRAIRERIQMCITSLFLFFFQNKVRENKNSTVLAFLFLLVKKRIFRKIELTFLMVGHTHADIDQFFSTISRKVFARAAKTLNKLKGLITTSTNALPIHIFDTSNIRDVRAFLTPALNNLFNHTTSHAFLFMEVNGEVKLLSKEWADDPEWNVVGSLLDQEPAGEIPFVPEKLEDIQTFSDNLDTISEKFFLDNSEKEEWETLMQNLLHPDDYNHDSTWDFEEFDTWQDRVAPQEIPQPNNSPYGEAITFSSRPYIAKARKGKVQTHSVKVGEMIAYQQAKICVGTVIKQSAASLDVVEWKESPGNRFDYQNKVVQIRKADIVAIAFNLTGKNQLPKEIIEALREIRNPADDSEDGDDSDDSDDGNEEEEDEVPLERRQRRMPDEIDDHED
jgi:hypothetical protein